MSQVNAATFANIRKESDFLDILNYETGDSIAKLEKQLQEAAAAAGTARSEFTDFLRERIGRIGAALNMLSA